MHMYTRTHTKETIGCAGQQGAWRTPTQSETRTAESSLYRRLTRDITNPNENKYFGNIKLKTGKTRNGFTVK